MLDMKEEERWDRLALITKILRVVAVLTAVGFIAWMVWGRR
ncbi:MAG TPA: hypothetical protein PL001_08310 [Candidatus Kryptobacter bacterium]|nr:hypothetical protein [Candidatus Kryptobacter bacterium]